MKKEEVEMRGKERLENGRSDEQKLISLPEKAL